MVPSGGLPWWPCALDARHPVPIVVLHGQGRGWAGGGSAPIYHVASVHHAERPYRLTPDLVLHHLPGARPIVRRRCAQRASAYKSSVIDNAVGVTWLDDALGAVQCLAKASNAFKESLSASEQQSLYACA